MIGDAIRNADLNLNPQVEGAIVRVPVPKASKETKEATIKLISKIAEAGKTRVRRVRQAALEKLKKMEGTLRHNHLVGSWRSWDLSSDFACAHFTTSIRETPAVCRVELQE